MRTARVLFVLTACAAVLVGVQAVAGASAHPLPNCQAKIIWTNPNPGSCVSVVVRISVTYPDALTDLTTTGQDSDPTPISLTAGGSHHFHTYYNSITAHETLSPTTIAFVDD